jgi:hypothetical protein
VTHHAKLEMSRIIPRLTLRTLLASLLMASPAIAGAAESSIAAIGGSLPTGGRITFSGDLTRVYQLGPGGQAEGKLVLHNPTGETRSARIYQTDYAFTAEGSASYGTPGSNPRSTAPWIELGEREAVLGAGETRTVSFKVNVPSERPAIRHLLEHDHGGAHHRYARAKPIRTR